MFRIVIFIFAILCMFTSEAVSKCVEPTEAQQVAKFADKVSRQGDELSLRLKDGKVISRKSARDWYGPGDCDGNTNIAYTFHNFIDPWYVIKEGYYESHGTLFINRDTGAEEDVSGRSTFSTDNARFLSAGYPGEGENDLEMWKVTPEGIIREWVLEGGVSYNSRWIDASTVEIAEDYQVLARVKYDGSSWKCSGAARICNALEISKDSGDSPDAVAIEKRKRWVEQRDSVSGEVIAVWRRPKEKPDVDADEKNGDPTLISAAREGDMGMVKSFLDNGAEIEATDEDGWTALEAASDAGQLDIVKFLVKRGAGASSKGYLNPPIMLAAQHGFSQIVKALLDNGADVNAVGEGARTPLMAAVWKKHLDVVQLLLEKGADPNARDEDCTTALTGPFNTLWSEKPETMKLLLYRGADPNAKGKSGQSALRSAAHGGDLEIIGLLLDNGADVNAKSGDGWTALMEASFRGHPAAVKLLLDRGADVNMTYENGNNAMGCAHGSSGPEVVKLLLENRSDVNLRDKKGLTALMEAARGGYLDIMKRLLERGADINAKDTHGWNALAWAAQSGHMDVAKVLKEGGAEMTLTAAACLADVQELLRCLRNGADVNQQGVNGGTPLMGAAEQGHSDMVKLLLDKGAEVNAKDKSGETALMASAKSGHSDVVRLLLEKAIDLNAKDQSDKTALMLAVSEGHLEVVKLLLNKGADINIKGEYCRTALDIAKQEKLNEIETLLRAHGAK